MPQWSSCIILPALSLLLAANLSADQSSADSALRRGADFLVAAQNKDGSWCSKPQPAVAALCALALHQTAANDTAGRDRAVESAMQFVISNIDNEDGAVRGPAPRLLFFKFSPWPVYTTSIGLVAMAEINKPEYRPLMQGARQYLLSMQAGDDAGRSAGGFGYDRSKRPDLSNSAWAAEAIYLTRNLNSDGPSPEDHAATRKMWQQFDTFLGHMQAPPDGEGENAGGFGYKEESDIVATGTMTYAGLKSMIYAQVDGKDPRVQGALTWIAKHYTFAEAPGAGMRGYYYYLQTMTKALAAAGIDKITLADGSVHDWRADAVKHIISLQQTDGSWSNPDGKYLEALPELVTAYAMISLKNCQRTAPPTH